MIDARKVRTLGKLLLKLETTSRNGSNRKLLFLNLSYLLPGVFLPWLLIKQNTDPSGFEFAFITYLFYSMIISFTIITELDNIIISKSETELITAMPLDDVLIVRAKMFMLLRYVTFLLLPLLLPGSIYFYSIVNSIPRALLYLASGFALCFFFVTVLTLLYSIALRTFKTQNVGVYTLIFQVILILCLITGYQFVSFGITSKTGSITGSYIGTLQAKGIIEYFPQAWFAHIPSKNNYIRDIALLLKLILPLFICYMSYISLRSYLSENYAVIREKYIGARMTYSSENTSKGFLIFNMFKDFIQSRYLKNSTERSSYGLLSSMYKRDKSVRLAVLPMIIIPAGLAVFALVTNQLPPLFTSSYYVAKPVMHISILLCILVVLNTAIIGVKVSNFSGASWIYDSYPVDSLRSFKNGFRKFFVVKLIIPLCLVTGIIYLFAIPFDAVAVNSIFIFASANLYNSLMALFSKALPFSKENTLINSLQRMSSMIFPLLFGVLIILVQLFAYKSILTAIIASLVIFTITFWINYFGFARSRNRQITDSEAVPAK